jgi:hypothetical protein
MKKITIALITLTIALALTTTSQAQTKNPIGVVIGPGIEEHRYALETIKGEIKSGALVLTIKNKILFLKRYGELERRTSISQVPIKGEAPTKEEIAEVTSIMADHVN